MRVVTKCELCGSEVSEKCRSYPHLKKAFVMFRIAYDNWEAPEGVPRMTFKQFRKNIIKKSGHYIAHYDLDGSLQLEAKSLKYSEANQDEFNEIYRDCHRYIGEELLRCGQPELHDMIMMEF